MNKFKSSLLMTGIAVFPGVSLAEIKWDLPMSLSPNNFLTGVVEELSDEVKTSTNGELIITVHSGASLYSQSHIKRAVQTGQVQIGDFLLSSYSNEDPLYSVDSVPFLADSYEEAWNLWQASKPFIEKRMKEHNMMVLYTAPLPPQMLYSMKPVESIDDLEGDSFRAYSPMTSRFAELVGAQPVTIMSSELSQALATGVVDSFITSSGTGYDTRTYEQVDYLYDIQAWIPKNLMVVNIDYFESLPESSQEALLTAAKNAEEKAWEISEQKHSWYLEQLEEHGMTVQEPNKILTEELIEVGKTIQNEWLSDAGSDGEAIVNNFMEIER